MTAPTSFSPWGMFVHADIVVQVVICGLSFASVLTWTIFLAKTLELSAAKRGLARDYNALREAPTLIAAAQRLAPENGVARALVREASEERQRSAETLDRDGLKERIALHLERVEAITGRRMMVGTGILATIGSTAHRSWVCSRNGVGHHEQLHRYASKMHAGRRTSRSSRPEHRRGVAGDPPRASSPLFPAVIIYNHFCALDRVQQSAGRRCGLRGDGIGPRATWVTTSDAIKPLRVAAE